MTAHEGEADDNATSTSAASSGTAERVLFESVPTSASNGPEVENTQDDYSFSITTGPERGTLIFTDDTGSYIYQADNYVGWDSFEPEWEQIVHDASAGELGMGERVDFSNFDAAPMPAHDAAALAVTADLMGIDGSRYDGDITSLVETLMAEGSQVQDLVEVEQSFNLAP